MNGWMSGRARPGDTYGGAVDNVGLWGEEDFDLDAEEALDADFGEQAIASEHGNGVFVRVAPMADSEFDANDGAEAVVGVE